MTKTVTFEIANPDGSPLSLGIVGVRLVAGHGGGEVGTQVRLGEVEVHLDADGIGSIELATNESEVESPAGSFYRATVRGSSPTVWRAFELTDDLPDTVPWTYEAMQLEDPETPSTQVSSDRVRVGAVSLTNYLAGLATGGAGSGAVPVDLLVATAAADGSATTFDILVWDQNAQAAGNVPARYSSVFPLPDVETFVWALAMAGFADDATVTVLVPGGSAQGVWRFTPATITAPWTEVATSLAIQPSASYLGVRFADDWRKLNDADTISYVGTGMLLGIDRVHTGLHLLEGQGDHWQTVSAMCLTTSIDINDPNPTMEHGQLVDGARFLLKAQIDPAENGTYFVSGGGPGAWEYAKAPPEGVFDPPGNGYETHLVAPGDPKHGLTLEWLEDDPTQSFRGGSLSEPAKPEGRWITTFDPTATGGGLDEAAVQALIDASVSALLDGAPGALDTHPAAPPGSST